MGRRLGSIAVVVGLAAAPGQSAAQIGGEVVDDSNGSGVSAAIVTLLDADGDSLATVVADADGRFELLWGGASGDYVLRVKALGYEGFGDPLQFDGDPILVHLRIAPAPVELDGLAVSVERRSEFLTRTGFYQRQRVGTGEFLDEESFPVNPVSRTAQLIQRVSGLRLERGREPLFSRSQGLRPRDRGKECYPVVVLDDVVVRTDRNIDDPMWRAFEDVAPSPGDVMAIELYRSAAMAPGQWKSISNECGVIAIWTKR